MERPLDTPSAFNGSWAIVRPFDLVWIPCHGIAGAVLTVQSLEIMQDHICAHAPTNAWLPMLPWALSVCLCVWLPARLCAQFGMPSQFGGMCCCAWYPADIRPNVLPSVPLPPYTPSSLSAPSQRLGGTWWVAVG